MFKKNEKKNEPRRTNYVWVLAGIYLLYLGGSLFKSVWKGEATNIAVNIAAGAVFVSVGVVLCLREWRIYRYGSKEEQEAMAKARALEEAQAAKENGEDEA